MRILFSFLSLFYVAAIFILAGSPVVETLSEFNPYSLLHIPLYGILAILLVFSVVPIARGFKDGSNQLRSDSTRPRSRGTVDLKLRFLVAGAIAWVVGIFDEVHQLSVPGRDASAGDVALDMVGIAIALLLCFILFKTRVLDNRDKA
jgi:membrane protease YdiL (CAAX protease family)